MTTRFSDDTQAMARALELAKRGVGWVEPNPPVGAVVVDRDGKLLGEGWHERFGGPHAEVHALNAAGETARGGTIYVTLEPCCHHGKTPPCTKAIIAAGIQRAVIATGDPAPHVAGGGLRELQEAGVDVSVGLLEEPAQKLIAPFVTLFTQGRPFVHAKWAMTLDGKIASRTGHSQWISGSASRKVVHDLRGRMDAILIGSGTAHTDDPLLTARPPGPRTALRIVVDQKASLPLSSKLVQAIGEAPLLIAATHAADPKQVARLQQAGVEVAIFPEAFGRVDIAALLRELGQRKLTNILIEGGGQLLGSFFDAGLIDEVHIFIAPKLVGGVTSPTPLAGKGLEKIPDLSQLTDLTVLPLEDDLYVNARLRQARGDDEQRNPKT